MTGRWKTLIAWGVIAVAGLIYLASLLPVVAAMEEGAAVVSDQLPSSASDTFSTVVNGTGGPRAETAADDGANSMDARDTGSDPPTEDTAPTAPSGDEEAGMSEPAAADETSAPAEETPVESGETTPVDGEDTTPTEPDETTPVPGDSAPTEPAGAEPTQTDPTGDLDPAVPAEELIEPAEPTLEELLASFIETRLGLIPYGTATFPVHNIDSAGEFVFYTPAIIGSNFTATEGRYIDTAGCYSALTSYGDGTMNGFELYKNKHDPEYGDFHLAMSAGGAVSFNNLAMEVTELYGHQLLGVRLYPLIDFWTTNPGKDLPLGEDEEPLDPNIPFYGEDLKVTTLKMTADHIRITNFSLTVADGKKQLEG